MCQPQPHIKAQVGLVFQAFSARDQSVVVGDAAVEFGGSFHFLRAGNESNSDSFATQKSEKETKSHTNASDFGLFL